MSVEPVVQTRDLTKRYGPVVAVDGLSLSVPGGQVFGLLGPNGSGKTTTLGLLLGLVRPTAGSVRLFGLNANGAQHGAVGRVGAIVETPSFYPHLSARDNLYTVGARRAVPLRRPPPMTRPTPEKRRP